jgi:hypothetical protein
MRGAGKVFSGPSRTTKGNRNRVLAVPLAAMLFVWPTTILAADLDAEPIKYSTAPANNVVERLRSELDSSKVSISRDPKKGYLPQLLKAFDVPVSSQVLVFSKTSLQRHRISPGTPRALYFNDDVYVGYCQQGDVLEVSAVDPQLGTVFYTVDQKEKAPDRIRFTRQTETCLLCHGSSANQGLPGHVLRSVYTDERGNPVLRYGTHRIDQTSPLKERWGGWYVTGTAGKQTHLGNLIVDESAGEPEQIDNSAGLNVTDLGERIKTSAYLSPHSDIVALMVLEHQTEMHNALGRAALLTRCALHEQATLNKDMGRPPGERWESVTSRISSAAEQVVRSMLMSGEAALTEKISGTSEFAREFAQRGPRDKKGRSLRDLDLQRRLFKYPCSYLIYSAAFDGLPGPVKDRVFLRLWQILSGKENGKEFAHLSVDDRRAILEILMDTKPTLPAYWRTAK